MLSMFRAVLLSLMLAGAAAKFEVAAEEDGVMVLTQDTFEAALEANPSGLMVEFYAPWCGHCKKLKPEYTKAAEELAKEDPPVKLAMVDATEERDLAEKYGVRGFPTLKFIKNGATVEYEGGRTARDIVAYMKKKTGPPGKEVTDAAALEKAKDSAEVVIAGYFKSMESPEAKVFLDAASSIDDFEFFYTTSDSVMSGTKPNTLVLYKDFDEKMNELPLTSSTTLEEVQDFVSGMSLPKVMEFSKEKSRVIFRGPIKVHMLTFMDLSKEYVDGVKATLNDVADTHRGKLLHIVVPSTEDRVLEYFGIKEDKLPATVIADMSTDGGMRKFKYEGVEHTKEELIKFEQDFFAGVLTPNLKSEKDTPANMKSPVKVIVGESFQKNVVESGKDVLLEFYAPWCGHCKSLAPKYDALGEKFEKVDSVMIAKMDATANEIDHPDIAVQGFPTLYWIPAEGAVEKYDGARETDDMLKFIRTHATKPFTLEDGIEGGPGFKDEL